MNVSPVISQCPLGGRWIEATTSLGIQYRYTRIYRPRTNGKAERLIQTLLSEWAYARSYPSSAARARTLSGYMRWYNKRRPAQLTRSTATNQPRLTPP